MNSSLKWALGGIFVCIILYQMAVVLSDASEPTVAEDIAFIQGTNNTLTNTPILAINSVSNATLTCTSGNYTSDTTDITMLVGATCVNGTYTVNYDYNKSETIFSIDFQFVAILVFLGASMYIVYNLTKH